MNWTIQGTPAVKRVWLRVFIIFWRGKSANG